MVFTLPGVTEIKVPITPSLYTPRGGFHVHCSVPSITLVLRYAELNQLAIQPINKARILHVLSNV